MKNPVTLKLNKEFKRAYYRGVYRSNPALTTYLLRTRTKTVRYGITTGKKIGNAVMRNRARRIIRAAFIRLYREYGWEHTDAGFDLVFVARQKTPCLKSTEVYTAMREQIKILLKK